MPSMRIFLSLLLVSAAIPPASHAEPLPSDILAQLSDEVLNIHLENRTAEEYRAAARAYATLLKRAKSLADDGKQNLRRPARVWTENALYQAYYAKLLLRDVVPTVCTENQDLRREMIAT